MNCPMCGKLIGSPEAPCLLGVLGAPVPTGPRGGTVCDRCIYKCIRAADAAKEADAFARVARDRR